MEKNINQPEDVEASGMGLPERGETTVGKIHWLQRLGERIEEHRRQKYLDRIRNGEVVLELLDEV